MHFSKWRAWSKHPPKARLVSMPSPTNGNEDGEEKAREGKTGGTTRCWVDFPCSFARARSPPGSGGEAHATRGAFSHFVDTRLPTLGGERPWLASRGGCAVGRGGYTASYEVVAGALCHAGSI